MPNRSDSPSPANPGPDPRTVTPREITQAGDRLSITWADGEQSLFDVRELRLACGCASCVDEWTGEYRLDADSVPQDVHPIQIDSVGRYAIQIRWSDGHDTGIYPFDRLRAMPTSAAPKGDPSDTIADPSDTSADWAVVSGQGGLRDGSCGQRASRRCGVPGRGRGAR